MRRVLMGTLLLGLALAGCEDDVIVVPVGGEPEAPRALEAFYYAGVVTVSWELAPGWNGESFRVYSRRVTDVDYFFIAEVTSCAAEVCAYEDRNVLAGQTYEYYVSAVDPTSGFETATDYSVEVFVPDPVPPPVPTGVATIALDNANYITWASTSRSADDFSFYRLYLEGEDGSEFLLGETDSEGFLDLLAANGETYQYFVTSVDDQGHESGGSTLAVGTPRPDYHGEVVYDFTDRPGDSGFRFQEDESTPPIMDGSSPSRHFRLEADGSGWWIVPGPDAEVYPVGFVTTALRCGLEADAPCADVSRAPTSGYTFDDVALEPQTSYVLRVRGDDGLEHYGVIRVEFLGFDQDDDALMIFDWAYQVQAGNPDLAPKR